MPEPAYQVDTYDADGRNVIETRYLAAEREAREDAVTLWRKHGPGSVKLMRLTWVGVEAGGAHPTSPVEVEELPIVDPTDPDVAEYLRLREKFRGLPVPEPTS